MLEKPDLQDSRIVACLHDGYGLSVTEVAFLPIGADRNTAVYRVATGDGTPYFCKLRSGVFDETSVALPRFLSDQGIAQIIAPLTTKAGRLWAHLDTCKVILYPYVEGRNAREVRMSARHWSEFGAALRRVHTVALPLALAPAGRIRRETYLPRWRDIVRRHLARAGEDVPDDPVAVEVDALLRDRHDEIAGLVARADRLAQMLQARPPPCTLCHSDVHASNVLIAADGAIYIVDWDDPILAPKERDLMFAGGAQGFIGHSAQEEEALFYRGYGQTEVDPVPLAYYRYERIVEDIAVYCEQLLLTTEGGKDREQSLGYLLSNFRPHGTIEVAYGSDRTQQQG